MHRRKNDGNSQNMNQSEIQYTNIADNILPKIDKIDNVNVKNPKKYWNKYHK